MVLLHHGSSKGPSLQLLEADNAAAAQEIADEILMEAPDGVGVEVWREGCRLYVRGVVPLRKAK